MGTNKSCTGICTGCFISHSQQYQNDAYVTLLIVAFWTFPPFILYLGLYFSRKYHRHTILLYIYYMYNVFYIGLLFSIVLYSLTFEKVLDAMENLMQERGFYVFWSLDNHPPMNIKLFLLRNAIIKMLLHLFYIYLLICTIIFLILFVLSIYIHD